MKIRAYGRKLCDNKFTWCFCKAKLDFKLSNTLAHSQPLSHPPRVLYLQASHFTKNILLDVFDKHAPLFHKCIKSNPVHGLIPISKN